LRLFLMCRHSVPDVPTKTFLMCRHSVPDVPKRGPIRVSGSERYENLPPGVILGEVSAHQEHGPECPGGVMNGGGRDDGA
jgi:hypothetical protein